jgi:threonine/homoserine/homoserine lactone efflux protein
LDEIQVNMLGSKARLKEDVLGSASLLSANLVLAYSAYALGAASPGPSNLAVMATAMNSGRRHALVFALGVVSGSTAWGMLAAFGLAALMAQYSKALIAMKVLGGLYLLWLSIKSLRSALATRPQGGTEHAAVKGSDLSLYLRGAAMHLTNPKAIFTWLSIVTLALPAEVHRGDALLIVAGCALIGLGVFGGYAIVFSTQSARKAYFRMRRCVDGMLAAVFGYAGIRMLASLRTP